MKKPIELADIVRRFGPAYLVSQGSRILPSQKKALEDIAACRTAALGGHQYRCQDCDTTFWVYHSCRNRSCPACHGSETRKWLDERTAQILECGYYHIIITIPRQMRSSFLADQKEMYSLLMKVAAECVIDLARDERFLGATPAILSVLHTWTGDIQYHPHVHMLVSAGGVSDDGQYWKSPRNNKWLIPIRALSALIRGRFRAHLERCAPDTLLSLPEKVWRDGWNSFAKYFGRGADTILNYLGRYVFRIAISNARIDSMDGTHVAFRNNNGKSIRLTGEEFLRRFVMHVLPKGFHKVRYYGLWHHSKQDLQKRARLLFEATSRPKEIRELIELVKGDDFIREESFIPVCPQCACRSVIHLSELRRDRSPPLVKAL
jgi:hypothetical protein